LVWTDADVQELLKKFVSAADEVNVILWQRGPKEREFFQKIGAQGHYGKAWQGLYAMTPSGQFLGSTNQRDAKVVAEMLRKALEKYQAMEKSERLMAQKPSREPEGRSLYPEGGLVLQQFSRDLPRPDGSDKTGYWAGAWNTDYAWFTKDEAKALVPASREPGARQAAPERVVRRIVTCHLIDNVRGEAFLFKPEHVKKAEFALVVTGAEGDRVHLRIEGSTKAEEPGVRGFEAALEGKATWDAKQERFVRFDLIASGPRFGGAASRQGDPGPAPLAVAFRLPLTSEPSDRVPPAFVLSPLGPKYFE
jgi:hypothetical protein